MSGVARGFFFFLEIGIRCSPLLQVPHAASGSAGIPFQVRSLQSRWAGSAGRTSSGSAAGMGACPGWGGEGLIPRSPSAFRIPTPEARFLCRHPLLQPQSGRLRLGADGSPLPVSAPAPAERPRSGPSPSPPRPPRRPCGPPRPVPPAGPAPHFPDRRSAPPSRAPYLAIAAALRAHWPRGGCVGGGPGPGRGGEGRWLPPGAGGGGR